MPGLHPTSPTAGAISLREIAQFLAAGEKTWA